MLLMLRRPSFDRICPRLGIGIGTGMRLIVIAIAIVLHLSFPVWYYCMIPVTIDNHFPNPVSPAGHDLIHSCLLIMHGVSPLAIGVEDC